jgi:hypothetical protein
MLVALRRSERDDDDLPLSGDIANKRQPTFLILIFSARRGRADQGGRVGFVHGDALVDEVITTIPHPPRGFNAVLPSRAAVVAFNGRGGMSARRWSCWRPGRRVAGRAPARL